MRRLFRVARAGACLALPIGLVWLGPGACSCRPAPAAPIRVAIHNDPISLDPHLQNEVLTHSVLANVFDALTAFDAEIKVGPSLAARWENPDDLTWRFHLRPEARFHDGRPVEAQDVAFSLERARSHPHGNVGSYLVEVKTIRALDRHRVEITTGRPFAGLLNKLAFIFVVPRDSPLEITAPVGSGAYRFVSFVRGRALKLEPVTGDWRSDPAGLPIEFLPIGDPSARVDGLLQGQVEIVQELKPSEVPRVQAAPSCRVVSRSSLLVEYLHLMADDPQFSDRRVREAIHLALDRRLLVETMMDGHGQPASQMVCPGVFGYDPGLVAPERDLGRARRLLAEAGYPNGFPVTLEFRVGRQGEEIARQLKELGLDVTLVSAPWPEVYARLTRREVKFYYGGVVAVSADASDVFDSFAHSHVEGKGYGNSNFNRYSNPALDAAIEGSAANLDMLQRRSLLQGSMRLLMADRYLIPIFSPDDLYGLRRDIVWEPRLDRLLLGREMRRAARRDRAEGGAHDPGRAVAR